MTPTYSPLLIGIFLTLLGASLVLIPAWAIRRSKKKLLLSNGRPPFLSQARYLSPHHDAILLIRRGGQIAYCNENARQLLKLRNLHFGVEVCARRARPREAFLELCASEGAAGIYIDEQYYEARSYRTTATLPNAENPEEVILLSLHRPSWSAVHSISLPADEPLASPEALAQEAVGPRAHPDSLQLMLDVFHSLSASLNLPSTIASVLENVERLIHADGYTLCLWENEQQQLVPYRLRGVPGAKDRIEHFTLRNPLEESLSWRLVKNLQPLIIDDLRDFSSSSIQIGEETGPFHAYLGIPLVVEGELVATLELWSAKRGAFNTLHLERLQFLCDLAGRALNNARRYTQEQKRTSELSGLASLAQVAERLLDRKELFAHFTELIAHTLNAQIAGFLLYDEESRTLKAQNPFYGLQANVVEWYQTMLHPGTAADRIWLSGDVLIATNAPQDTRLQTLKLHHLAEAAGIKHTVFIPLMSGGRNLGYLQVANKLDGTPFDARDIRLLSIFAGQAAAMIENALLMEASRRRARRAETLRRIASLTSSSATVDEILKFSILDLARLLEADIVAAFLLDKNQTALKLHSPSTFGIPPELSLGIASIPIESPRLRATAFDTDNEVIFFDLEEEPLRETFYHIFRQGAEIRALVALPLKSSGKKLGELVVGSRQAGFFSHGDLQTISTAAVQMAAAIERQSLLDRTDSDLRRQLEHFSTLARIQRELNASLEVQELLAIIHKEAMQNTGADGGTVLWFPEPSKQLPKTKLRKASSLAQMTRKYYGELPNAEWLPRLRQVLSGKDTQLFTCPPRRKKAINEAAQTNAIGDPSGTTTSSAPRACLLVPIKINQEVRGAIYLHSQRKNHFEKSEKDLIEALASQAGLALENATSYAHQQHEAQKLADRTRALWQLHHTFQSVSPDLPLKKSLHALAQSIRKVIPSEAVLLNVYGEEDGDSLQKVSIGPQGTWLEKNLEHMQTFEALQALLTKAQPLRAGVYALSRELLDGEPLAEPGSFSSLTIKESTVSHAAIEKILIVLVQEARKRPRGMLCLGISESEGIQESDFLELIGLIQEQCTWMIEHLFFIKRLKQSIFALQSQTYTALRSIEGRASVESEKEQRIQQLEQKVQRLSIGIEALQSIRAGRNTEEVIENLARVFSEKLGFEYILWVEPFREGMRLTNSWGRFPPPVKPETLLGQFNPIYASARSGQALLVSAVDQDSEWQSSPLIKALQGKSFVCLPILLPQELAIADVHKAREKASVHAVLLAISCKSVSEYTPEDVQLFQLLSKLTANAVQQIHILEVAEKRFREVNLLFGFSQKLGSLEPGHIYKALVETASQIVPAAQSIMVALWDQKEECLKPEYALGFKDAEKLYQMRYRMGEGLPGQVVAQKATIQLDEVEFTVHYNLPPHQLELFRAATGGLLPVSSLGIPITTRGSSDGQKAASPLGVLILNNSEETGVFTAQDIEWLSALAHQTALTLENAELYQAAKRRSSQLQALTTAATTVTAYLKPESLIENLLPQLRTFLPFDTATLWMRSRGIKGAKGESQLTIRAALGFENDAERLGISVEIEDSLLLKEMMHTKAPLWVPNVLLDERFGIRSAHSQEEGTTDTATIYTHLSWLGVPMITSDEVIGVIAIEKKEADFYSADDIRLAMTFANQAAIGLENAALFQESLRRAEELDQRSRILTHLNRLSSALSSTLDVASILQASMQAVTQLITCSSVSVLFAETPIPEIGRTVVLRLVGEYPLSFKQRKKGNFVIDLSQNPTFEHLYLSGSLFSTDQVPQEADLKPLASHFQKHGTRAAMLIPLIHEADVTHNEGRFVGLVIVHHSEAYHFTPEELELARTIVYQTEISLQNARLFEETRRLTEELEERVRQRTAELEKERHRAEALLHFNTELSASLDLDHVMASTLQSLSNFVDAKHITILISRPDEEELIRVASLGYAHVPGTKGSHLPFKKNEGLSGWILQNREAVLIDDVQCDPRWIPYHPSTEDRTFIPHRSALGVPLMSGAEALGCLLLFHPEAGHFSEDQLELVRVAANQVAVAVNNAELFSLIRDQAEDLGSMLRMQQIETSRSKAILESVADGVLVTNAQGKISLFNHSAEEILGLERAQVLNQSIEHFSGLFGKATKQWTEKIAKWSQEPGSYQSGETYSEQIILEDQRVIAVQLSPVTMGEEFLGTVSIFRDITHQVEVDRLKTEFLATVSHELRTPMTSIKGYVEVLLMGAAGPLNTQQEHYLEIVKENTDRLTLLVNDLLDVSRIEAGRITLAIQPMNLIDVINNAIEEIERRSREEDKPIHIEKDFPDHLPPVLGDAERIRQILDNLLDNAYQYNHPEGKITIRLRVGEEALQVDVIDNGVGIHPAELPHVFDRFFRGENPLVLGIAGTGLGLSIVKSLVEMHHGRIWASSEGPGKGSTFSFTLPIYTPSG